MNHVLYYNKMVPEDESPKNKSFVPVAMLQVAIKWETLSL